MSEPRLLQVGRKDVDFGQDVTIIEPTNLYGCEIGDGAFIGPFTEIQAKVKIGARTRVQSHSFVCELVTIGDDCVVAHGVMFTNDRFRGGPAGGDASKWEETHLADRVSIGSGATILPVSICSDVVIGAGAVVTKDITEPGTYVGNPARKVA